MAKPLRCRIAGCLLLEPPTESLLQAPSRSRKAAYACSGRMCPQAPHLRQHRSRPRHLLEVLRSHYVMVAQYAEVLRTYVSTLTIVCSEPPTTKMLSG